MIVTLAQAHQQAIQLAEKKLRPPPILEERKQMGAILQEDSDLDNFDSSNWIFTDISQECDKASVSRYRTRTCNKNVILCLEAQDCCTGAIGQPQRSSMG